MSQSVNKPNFLYIMTDQLRADWLGCYGHPVVKTPNIDALAAQGARFEKFYVATPVCMPNRASFMTGRFPSVHGLRYNGCLLSKRANTFVDVLKAGGYATATMGKSHLQPFTEIEAQLPKAVSDEAPIKEAWKTEPHENYILEQPEKYRDDTVFEFPTPYYGFDHVDVVTGHGDKAGGHYFQWFRERHPDWQALRDPKNELPHNYSCNQAYRTPIPEESYPTAYICEQAKNYLRGRANQDDPFFAFVSFADPHHPFNPPGKYWDMYDPDDFDVPLRFSDHENPPPPLKDAYGAFQQSGKQKTLQTAFMAEDRHLKEIMALSAGMLTMIDDAVGEIIETLKASGQYENTVIVFNADHGDYMGDSELVLKGAWSRESINRVPMIWSDPRDRTASVVSGFASTVDLAPTICERAGLDMYNGVQGLSFLGALQGQSDMPRKEIFIEYNDGMARMGFETAARVRTLRTEDWQLAVYQDQDWGELYDLRSDPDMVRNLWNDPSKALDKLALYERLTEHLMNQMDASPQAKRLA